MKEFRVNNFIKLRLKKGKTIIYVNEKRFNQCKYILIRKTIQEFKDLLEFESVDELKDYSIDNLTEELDNSLESINYRPIDLPSETKFWAHCSNMQIWAENNYDTNLLHSNLAFPLLRELKNSGDSKAEKVLEKEVLKRLDSGYWNTVVYLIENKYTEFIDEKNILPFLLNLNDLLIYQDLDPYKELKWELIHSDKLNDSFNANFIINQKNIVGLFLDDMNLNEIPMAITRLKSLKKLYLCGNNIKEIPNEIGKLHNLEDLRLSANNLSTLPETFKNLNNLKILTLDHNSFDKVPEAILNIKSIKHLYLNNNKIKKIPSSILNIKSLKFLDLKYNLVEETTDTINYLRSNEVLDLRYNKIKNKKLK